MKQTIDWHAYWTREKPGFHEGRVNSYLSEFLPRFDLRPGDCVFVPLCGKAHDLHWLWSQGLEVIGVELSEVAVQAFFREFDIPHQVDRDGDLNVYSAAGLTLYQGDFLHMRAEHLDACKLVYDRASLVAIESFNREAYRSHLLDLLPAGTPMLVVTLEYDQALMQGPPFSVPLDEIKELYSHHFSMEVLRSNEQIEERAKWRESGLTSFKEIALRLIPR
jgi:thiopurine S-methyltransferase